MDYGIFKTIVWKNNKLLSDCVLRQRIISHMEDMHSIMRLVIIQIEHSNADPGDLHVSDEFMCTGRAVNQKSMKVMNHGLIMKRMCRGRVWKLAKLSGQDTITPMSWITVIMDSLCAL